MPVVIIIRCLSPFLVIRFGQLRAERIGHFAGNTELYLCERDLGTYGSKTHDIFYVLPPICNNQLKKMWERSLNISPFAYLLKWLSIHFIWFVNSI